MTKVDSSLTAMTFSELKTFPFNDRVGACPALLAKVFKFFFAAKSPPQKRRLKSHLIIQSNKVKHLNKLEELHFVYFYLVRIELKIGHIISENFNEGSKAIRLKHYKRATGVTDEERIPLKMQNAEDPLNLFRYQ